MISPRGTGGASSHHPRVSGYDSLLCYWAVKELGISATSVANKLDMHQSSVSRKPPASRHRKKRINACPCLFLTRSVGGLWICDVGHKSLKSSRYRLLNRLKLCQGRISLLLNQHVLKIPYCYSHELGQQSDGVLRAVIVVHGQKKNAPGCFRSILKAVSQVEGTGQETIVLAPQFLVEKDVDEFCLGEDVLFWNSRSWKQGDESENTKKHPRPEQVTSFAVVDNIMERLADRSNFPQLLQIVVAGHSAGGQFVNRYAAGSPVHSRIEGNCGIQLRYIAANPSSYLYLDGKRCVKGEIDHFEVPDFTDCPAEYNKYKYGLENLNDYMAATGAAEIRSQYQRRELIYLLGNEDDNPDSCSLDNTCMAKLQGRHRLERGIIYYNYLLAHYEGEVQNHKRVIVPNVGHSSNDMFNSKIGVKYLFELAG